MVGLWEGMPASPCSGASDDLPSTQLPSRFSRRIPINTRSRYPSRWDRSESPDSSVAEFVDVSLQQNEKGLELVAKLNTAAADERRKMLLAQLRIIDERKAKLKSLASNGITSAASSRDIPTVVIEAATPEPFEGDTMELAKPVSFNSGGRRKPILALDMSAVRRVGTIRTSVEGFCSSPTPTAGAVLENVLSSPAQPSNGSLTFTHADLPTRRAPRRATRPRTPSVLLNGLPGETVLQKLPVGVLKCKRYSFCKKVISILFKNPAATPFCAPVSELWKPEAIPRYFDVITRPMDLGTIKKNMEGASYLNTEETNPLFMFKPELFAEDVLQVFRNAMIYNKHGDVLYNCASDLMHDFEQMWNGLPELPSRSDSRRKRQATTYRSGASKRGRVDDVTQLTRSGYGGGKRPLKAKKSLKQPGQSVSSRIIVTKLDENMTPRQMKKRLDYLRKCRVALRSRIVLPKGATFYDRAGLLYDVDLSDAQKNEIAKGIKRLPASKLATFLSIVGNVANAEGNDDEEVELDILSLDTKTLRNIEAFLESTLSNFKTIRNSAIGEEFCRVDEFETELNLLEVRLADDSKKPRSGRKEPQASELATRFVSSSKESEELYASSDSDSGASDSDSDVSDSDSD